MKYVKPNGVVLDIHERSVEYVETLGWKPFVEMPVEKPVEKPPEKPAPKKVAKKKAAKKKVAAKKKLNLKE